MKKTTQKHLLNIALLSFALSAGEIFADEAAQAAASAPQPVFATVGDTVITPAEFKSAFDAAARAKFYHGNSPQNEVALLQREVAGKMVARILLLREAKQRGLRPDAVEIEKTVQSYDLRYANSEQWKISRAKVLPSLLERLEQDSLLSQLEKDVRGLVKPDAKDAEAYYLSHPDKFTQPEQLRVAVILLKVDPRAPAEAWAKAAEEANGLVKRLRDGADLAELARLHSGDSSAEQGGDMGYLHDGMLSSVAQEALSKLKVGEITDAVHLLEGIAVFRLTDRKAPRLMTFDAVKVRAQELAQSEQKEAAWTGFVAELKRKTPAQIDQSQFLPLVEPSIGQGNVK